MASIRHFISSLSPSKTKVKPPSQQEVRDSTEDSGAGQSGSGDLLQLCLGFQRWRERQASLLTLPRELRDIIFRYVLGDGVGKLRDVAYGHVELQLDVDCALAYTCMSLRREFNDHVYRNLSNSLRLANQTMIIYPFKTHDWAATLAQGLCSSCEPADYIQIMTGHFTTLKLCEGVPPAFREDNLSTIVFLDIYVWCLRARISPCRCIRQRTAPSRSGHECTQLRRKPTVLQRISSWTTTSPKSRSVSDPARYEISSPFNASPRKKPCTAGERSSESAPEASVFDVLDYYCNTRSSSLSIARGTSEQRRLSTVTGSSCNVVVV